YNWHRCLLRPVLFAGGRLLFPLEKFDHVPILRRSPPPGLGRAGPMVRQLVQLDRLGRNPPTRPPTSGRRNTEGQQSATLDQADDAFWRDTPPCSQPRRRVAARTIGLVGGGFPSAFGPAILGLCWLGRVFHNATNLDVRFSLGVVANSKSGGIRN